MLNTRNITPHQDVTALMTGHFIKHSGYFAYRPHGTQDYLLTCTLAGIGRFSTRDGTEHLTHPYNLMLIPAGCFQDYSVEKTLQYWEFIWVHFQPRMEWIDLLNWPQLSTGILSISVPEPLRGLIFDQVIRVHQSSMSSRPLRERIAMNALELLFLHCEQCNPNRLSQKVDPRMRRVMDHVIRNLDSRHTIDTLAAFADLSPSRLGHLFRQNVGVSPMIYVERQRIDRAKQLLQMTALSIKEISRQVGYDTQFYFSLRFKKCTGQSPLAYRQQAARTDPPP